MRVRGGSFVGHSVVVRFVLCLFPAITGCASDGARIDNSRSVPAIDVAVADESVVVYPQGDLSCMLGGSQERAFPELGECVILSDATVLVCESAGVIETCFEEVSVDGQVPYIGAPTDLTRPFAINVNVHADSILTLRGCGLDVELPLPTTRPTPTLEATVDVYNHVVGTWATDVPADSSFVQILTGFGGRACRITGSSHDFGEPAMLPHRTSIRVQPLSAPVTHVEGATTIRLWGGNSATVQF